MTRSRASTAPREADRRWSALLLALTLSLLLAALVMGGAHPGGVAVAAWMAVTASLAAVIVWRAKSSIGWLIQTAVLIGALGGSAQELAARGVRSDNIDAMTTAAAWIAHWVRIPALGAFAFLFLLFPTGRLPSPRWRLVAGGASLGIVLVTISVALTPGPMAGQPAITNPFGVAGLSTLLDATEDAGSVLLTAGALAGVMSLFVRLRTTSGGERQQIKWLLYAASLLTVTGIFAMVTEGSLNELSFVGLLAGLFALPVALTIALTRYRLYDIDLVINRTIVYAALTACVIVLYILIVGVMGSLLQQRVGLVPALVATGIVAVVFQPLRRMAQAAVDGFMFGERRDPYGALTKLSARLESTFDPDLVMPAIVETLARSMKLAYVAIEVESGDRYEVAASTGPQVARSESLPLVYGGVDVGRLVFAPKRGDALSPADLSLLSDLARNAGASVHAVALTAALRRSRNELLAAREEERRRLRRDLHDGLGPELAGIALGVGAARNLAETDGKGVQDLLGRLQDQAETATRSIRGLVEGLRPPSLDDLGLVETVRQKAKNLVAGTNIALEVIASDDVLQIPAAVEIAAMRIALEAVTNVVRHSGASHCTLTLLSGDSLIVEVKDDGNGIGEVSKGVGLVSMRERTGEVGGSFTIDSSDAGTTVKAVLPLR